MAILLPTPVQWDSYALLDTGDGKRFERFGKYTIVRPDPQIIWHPHLDRLRWEEADAVFERPETGKEQWRYRNSIPEKWLVAYKDMSFYVKLTPFKHTGVFPEQTVQWDWINEKIQIAKRPLQILNLFAYTGIASLVAGKNGASVTHVDGSKQAIGWAKENQLASHLAAAEIRYILDDVIKFTSREIRRGKTYDGIIMDPPVYGHGPHGEKWEFTEDFPLLMANCQKLLSKDPIFVVMNAYAISSSALIFENILHDLMPENMGKIEVGELILKEDDSERLLSTGIFGRWAFQ